MSDELDDLRGRLSRSEQMTADLMRLNSHFTKEVSQLKEQVAEQKIRLELVEAREPVRQQ